MFHLKIGFLLLPECIRSSRKVGETARQRGPQSSEALLFACLGLALKNIAGGFVNKLNGFVNYKIENNVAGPNIPMLVMHKE